MQPEERAGASISSSPPSVTEGADQKSWLFPSTPHTSLAGILPQRDWLQPPQVVGGKSRLKIWKILMRVLVLLLVYCRSLTVTKPPLPHVYMEAMLCASQRLKDEG